jgi:beta-mannanase
MPRKILWCFLLLLATVCFSSCATSTSTTTTTTTIPSVAGCYIGAFVNGLSNTPSFESAIGKNLAVSMLYIDWSNNFPSADCTSINNYGGVPIVTWAPDLNTTNTLDAISNGNYDSYLTAFANDARNWGNLVYLRFAHEMNGNWYPWDGSHNGQAAGPAKYIAAWKHIHDIFVGRGASNVKFVWSPNSASLPGQAWNAAANYYPGNSYVDWIAIDGYNWGGAGWQTFGQIFGASYSALASYGKPMMIGEFASAENGGDKAAWITGAFNEIKNDYPEFKIFVWFNINKEEDWTIDSSANSLVAFKQAINDSYFLSAKPNN